jgi:hypothetical protein
MLVAILASTLYGGDDGASTPAGSVRVCNAMPISLDGVLFETSTGGGGAAVDATLKPGACTDAPSMAPGEYTLRFIEHGPKGEAAMCARRVTVKPGDIVRISPDDGAQCVR